MGSAQKPMAGENRMDALFNYRKPDRVPIGSLWLSIGFNTVSAGGTVAEAYDNPERLTQMALDHIMNVLGIWVKRFGPDNLFVWMSSPSESNQVISPKHFKRNAPP